MVKDAAPTKALPGVALRQRRHDNSNPSEDSTERAVDDRQQQEPRQHYSPPSLPPALVPTPPPRQQSRKQNQAEAIEAEQRAKLKQRFGAHDGL